MVTYGDTRKHDPFAVSDLAAAASAFGLTIEGPPSAPLGGAINEVVRIRTERGDLVMRIHRPEMTPERLTAVHAVQDNLRANGLPIPESFRTRDGATWTTIRDRLAEVLRFVPGGHEADTWEDAASSFAMLGRLHVGLRKIRAETLPPPIFGCFVTPSSALALLAATEPAFTSRQHHRGAIELAEVRAWAESLLGQLQVARRAYRANLPHQLIHGDYAGKNVLLSGGQVVAILDFDRLAVRERIYELATALFVLLNRLTRNGFTSRGADGRLSDNDLVQIARLLRQYGATVDQPLTATELVALPYEMARTPLYPIVAAELSPTDAVLETVGAGQHLVTAQWLADQASRVSQMLLDAVDHTCEARGERMP